MEILDRHFMALPERRKAFIMIIIASYFVISMIAYFYRLTTIVESLLIIIIGLLFSEMLKMQYRVEALEKKKR